VFFFQSRVQVALQLTAQLGAVKMLRGRLELIVAYLHAVDTGDLPRNEEIFRRAAALCHRMPIHATERFKREYENVSEGGQIGGGNGGANCSNAVTSS
jgi:hypothetical protein